MKKPERCQGCLWYGDGEGFVPDEGEKAEVLFIAQNPGETEETQARPLIGVTGQMFRGRFVGKHFPGVKVAYANVLKCRGANEAGVKTNAMPPVWGRVWGELRDHCQTYLEETLAKNPKAVLVPMGEYAAEAVTGMRAKTMIHLRGTVVEEK